MRKRKIFKEMIAKMRIAEGVNRNFWYEVKTKENIDFLQKIFGGFHDSVITKIEYQNARWLSDRTITCSLENEILSIFFRSQWVDPILELKFFGVCRLNLVGYQKNFESYLYNSYLDFHNDEIVFADTSSFDIEKDTTILISDDIADVTFVIAKKLIWQIQDI